MLFAAKCLAQLNRSRGKVCGLIVPGGRILRIFVLRVQR